MRREDDSWDITTSVGSTALVVAAARALETQKSEPLASDPYAEAFCRAVGADWSELLDGGAPDHLLRSEIGGFLVDFQGARTKYFDDYVRAAANAGIRQVVIVAAGLDSRGYRLPWPDGTTVFELDQPQVLQFKREVLAQHGDGPTAYRREIAVDLRDDWPQALRDNGFDPLSPSAWIAEGLLLYLPASAQSQLFIGIDSLAAPGSRVAVEENLPMPTEVFEAAVKEERAARDEHQPFFQLRYNEQHAPAARWFSEHGWRAVTTSLAEYLSDVGRPVPPPDSDAGPMIHSVSLISAVKV